MNRVTPIRLRPQRDSASTREEEGQFGGMILRPPSVGHSVPMGGPGFEGSR